MFRIDILLLSLALGLYAQNVAAQDPISPPGTVPIRTVGLCVLSDRKTPISRTTIENLIDHLSADYTEQVGIAFKMAELHDHRFASDARDPKIQHACAAGNAILIFTNRNGVQRENGEEKELLGMEYPGVVWIYRTARRTARESSAFTTLEHEIAHLFGVDDDNDPQSFMNSRGRGTSWTPTIRRIIRDHSMWEWGGKDDIT